jgi:hypothetical protein
LDKLRCRKLEKHSSEMFYFYRKKALPFHIFKRGDLVQFRRMGKSRGIFQGTVYKRGKRHLMVVSRNDPGNVSKSSWRIIRGFSNSSYEK